MTVLELQKIYLPEIAPEDFFVLLSHATAKEKAFLLAHPEYEIPETAQNVVLNSLARRHRDEPVAYIVGHKEFYKRDFAVTRATLIPRPETEHLIEQALGYVDTVTQDEMPIDIVDIGTGSGNIIITLATELTASPLNLQFFGIDSSGEALAVAVENARAHHVLETITFIESDLLSRFPLPNVRSGHLIIIANLPYLSYDIYHASPNSVQNYEPKSALISGADGLDHYRRLLQELAKRKQYYQSLLILFEISPEQSAVIQQEIIRLFPMSIPEIIPDLSGKNRLIRASLL